MKKMEGKEASQEEVRWLKQEGKGRENEGSKINQARKGKHA